MSVATPPTMGDLEQYTVSAAVHRHYLSVTCPTCHAAPGQDCHAPAKREWWRTMSLTNYQHAARGGGPRPGEVAHTARWRKAGPFAGPDREAAEAREDLARALAGAGVLP